jgi:tRNA pseudouridine55 synthase
MMTMNAPNAPARIRVARRAVHGVLLLDKPLGLSSHDALQRARRLYRAEKAGHTGTLDPLATGLLPLAFGAATKFSQVALDADKAYRATLKLGTTTTTGDGEGALLRERPLAFGRDDIDAACRRYAGEIDQLPPMHSALKHAGRALYDYARAGIVVERPTRRVTIHRIDVVGLEGDLLTLDVRCSKGTYIRTLAEGIGEVLGCGAHLAALRRTASGALELGAAHTLDEIAALTEAERDALLLPADALLADWPAVQLAEADAARFLSGLQRRLDAADRPQVRVHGPGAAFLGSARIAAGELIPTRLLSPLEARAVADSAAATPPRAA